MCGLHVKIGSTDNESITVLSRCILYMINKLGKEVEMS